MMNTLENLHRARSFRTQYLSTLRTLMDLEIVCEIGFHQESGVPLNAKCLYTLDIGPAATLRRRIARLGKLGLVLLKPSAHDKRVKNLLLSGALLRALREYARTLTAG